MVKPIDITKTYELSEVLREHHVMNEEDVITGSRILLSNPELLIFLDQSICVVLEEINSSSIYLHVYCTELKRGRQFMLFLRKVEQYVKNNTAYSTVFMRPPENRKEIHLLARMNGARKIEEGLYTYEIRR